MDEISEAIYKAIRYEYVNCKICSVGPKVKWDFCNCCLYKFHSVRYCVKQNKILDWVLCECCDFKRCNKCCVDHQ